MLLVQRKNDLVVVHVTPSFITFATNYNFVILLLDKHVQTIIIHKIFICETN